MCARFSSDECREAAWSAYREREMAVLHEALSRAVARVERLQRAKG